MYSFTLIWSGFTVCLLLSFLLSGMEAGVFALSRLRIRQQLRVGRPSAALLQRFLDHPENFLWTILVGNTLANFFIFGCLVMVLHTHLRQHQFWFILVFSLCVFFFYAFFDLLPKMIFRLYPNRLCLFCARPFRLIHLVLRPLVSLVESASDLLLRLRGGKAFTGHLFGNREELRLVMQESSQGLTSEERLMINRVLDLQTITVRQVMSPLSKIVTIPSDLPLSSAFEVAKERRFTRIPVGDSRPGQSRIIGLLSLHTLLYEEKLDLARPVSDFIRPALFLGEDLRLETALRRMQRGGQRLAIVLSRDQREIGILSLQDILRVIFGEVTL